MNAAKGKMSIVGFNREAKLDLSNLLMLASVCFLLSTIFLFPENGGILKYASRVLVLSSFMIYIFAHHTQIPKDYFLWAFTLSFLFAVNVLFAYNTDAAFSTFLLVMQALWISFAVSTWLISSKCFKLVFCVVIALSVFYCIRLFGYIGLINWGHRKVGLMLGTNVNAIGMRLAFASLLSIYLFFSTERKYRIIYLLCFVLFGSFILITGSRRALILYVIAFILFYLSNSRNFAKKVLRIGIVVGVLAFIYSLTQTIPQLYSIIGVRINEFFSSIFSSDDTLMGADYDRVLMIRRGLELFFERPFTGWGMGNFRYVSGIDHEYSHNNFIELLFAAGFVVLATYYFFVFFIGKKYFKTRKRNYETTLCLSFLILGLVADLAAPNYTTLVSHLMIAIPFAIIKVEQANSEIFKTGESNAC